MNLLKKLLLLLVSCSTYCGFSQTLLLSEDFNSYANTALVAGSGAWQITTTGTTFGGANSATPNKWYIWDNTVSGCPITTRSLAVGTNAGTLCTYGITQSTDVVAYYATGIDMTNYTAPYLYFNAKVVGENGWDFVRFVYGYTASSTTPPTTWTNGGQVPYNTSTAATFYIAMSCPSNTYLWIGFEWKNDNSAGTAPPAVIDDITLYAYSTAQDANVCATAQNITLNAGTNIGDYSGSIGGSNVCSSADQSNSTCQTNHKNNWYTFTAPISGNYYIQVLSGVSYVNNVITNPAMTRPEVVLWSGTCGALTQLNCVSWTSYGPYTAGQPYTNENTYYGYVEACGLTAGQTYYVMVDNNTGGATGSYQVSVTHLTNDNISNAVVIATCGASFNSSTIGGTNCDNCAGYTSLGVSNWNNLDCNTATNCGGTAPCTNGGDVSYSIENDTWYQFCTTTAATFSINFTPSSSSCIGPGTALQMSVYTGSPGSLTYSSGTPSSGVSASTTYTLNLAAGQCAYVDVDGYAGTNCDYSLVLTANPGCPLPLGLINFTGEFNESTNINTLTWVTAEESDVYYYVLEKSTNGKDYLPFSQTRAMGNTVVRTVYTAYDTNPVEGYNYYRLSHVDKNGEQNIMANTVVTNIGKKRFFRTYPNPSSGMLNIHLGNFTSDNVSAEITDIYGKTVWSSDLGLENGSIIKQLDLNAFDNGMYFITINDGAQSYRQSVVIRK